MQKITNIKFMSFEFDFGYNKEDENSFENKGRIDAEILVEIENDGEISVVSHRVNLKDISFSDFMSGDDIVNIIKSTDSLDDYIQILRKVITLKVANDLGAEVVGVNYVAPVAISKIDLKQQIDLQQQAIDDLIINILPTLL